MQVLSVGDRREKIESLSFVNHTECHCISRQHLARLTTRLNSDGSFSSISNAPTTSQSAVTQNCNCVKYFVPVSETTTTVNSDVERSNNKNRCRCDCDADNATCEGYKQGREGFSIDDRR